MRRLLTLSALLVLTALCHGQEAVSFCNPCNLPYRFCLRTDDTHQASYREAADPTMVLYKGEYYLFASKCGGYFHSTDLVNWQLIKSDDLPIEGYAPTVEEMNGRLYFTYSLGTREIYTTDDPLGGNWERVESGGTEDSFADPMLFFDKGRMFLYYGSSGDPESYIQGMELDTETLAPIGSAVPLLKCRKETNGWEVAGDYNERKDVNPWLEGAWVNEHEGRYYLQYSSPGTEAKAYNDAVYVSDNPLGPYSLQRSNPFAYRPEGFMAGAGHGSTFKDKYGNYWRICTGTISRRHMFERRLALYPVFFDEDGEMYAYTAFGDWPMLLPDHHISSPEELTTGWMLLSYGKPVEASSALDNCPARYATDEDIRTWWSAATANEGEYITVDLGRLCDINALQVNFADQDAMVWGEQEDVYRYRVEVSNDKQSWTTIVDKSTNEENAPHDYVALPSPIHSRYVRLYNVHCPFGRFSVSGLRVFGTADVALPQQTRFTAINRNDDDRRTVHLEWEAVEDAMGYNIRFGYAPDKLYNNYTVFGQTSLDINSLNTEERYYFAIDSFNEAGVTRGTELTDK